MFDDCIKKSCMVLLIKVCGYNLKYMLEDGVENISNSVKKNVSLKGRENA